MEEVVSPAAFRRLAARMVDLALLMAVSLVLAPNFESNWWIGGLIVAAMVPVETVLIKLLGWTPGKLIFGLRSVGPNGQAFTWGTAAQRSFLVFVFGLACGIFPVTLVTLVFAYRRYVETESTLWDDRVGTRVTNG